MSLCTALTVSAQENCTNGVDDDGDGFIDLNDDECVCTNILPLTDVFGNPCTRIDLTLDVPGATSYQWYKDGVAVDDETSSEIEINKFAPLGDGTYQVIAQTPTGCVASEPYVVMAESFFEDLGIISVCEGDTIVIGGFPFTTEGKQQFKTQTSEGCDSSVCLTIVFVDATTIPEKMTLCEGATFVSEGGNVVTTTDLVTTDTIRSVGGCDSILYEIDVRFEPLQTQFIDTTICHGETFLFRGELLTNPGMHTVISQDLVFGCDSTFIIELQVREEIRTNLPRSICQGSVFEEEGLSVSEAGSYDVIYESAIGCDSIVTVDLTVDPPITETIEGTFCRGQIFERGDFSTDLAGTFTHESSLGECDSLITFIIRESDVEERVENESFCEGGNFQWRGMTLSENGRFEDLEVAPGECDVLHILELTMMPAEPIIESGSVCQGLTFEWRGMVLTEAGMYTDVVEAAGQCTEIYQLELTEEDIEVRQEVAEICSGDAYTEFGLNEREAGVYMAIVSEAGLCDVMYEVTLKVLEQVEIEELTVSLCPGMVYENGDLSTSDLGSHIATLVADSGCDSIVMVNLIGGFLPEMLRVEEICEGDIFEFQGMEITEEGMYSFTVESITEGCDTSLVIDLQFRDEIEVNSNVSICEGEIYERHDLVLTETGIFTTTFADPNGCDSLITVNLTVIENSESFISPQICEGDFIAIEGTEITEEGPFSIVISNVAGCDSTINGNLSYYDEIPPTEFDADICEGEVYTFEDIEETETGTYETIVPSFTGCDSTIIIHLEVLPLNERDDFVEICPGDVVSFFGNDLTEPGVYTERFSNVVGCDSVVTLVLDFDSELGDFQLENQVSLTIGEELIIEPTEVDENFVSFHWFNEDGDIVSTSRELEGFTPLEDTFFELEAVSVNGCEVVKRVRVDVELIIDIYVPNVIILGEDGSDALFTIGANASVVGLQELRILDRWGEAVFIDSHDGNLDTYVGWNGRFRGKEVQPAVFAYFAVFEIIDGSTVTRKGSLTVLK